MNQDTRAILINEYFRAIRKAELIGGSEKAQMNYVGSFFAKGILELIGPDSPEILAELKQAREKAERLHSDLAEWPEMTDRSKLLGECEAL